MNIFVGDAASDFSCLYICVSPDYEINPFNIARLLRLSYDGVEQLNGKISYLPEIDYNDDAMQSLKIIGVDVIEDST